MTVSASTFVSSQSTTRLAMGASYADGPSAVALGLDANFALAQPDVPIQDRLVSAASINVAVLTQAARHVFIRASARISRRESSLLHAATSAVEWQPAIQHRVSISGSFIQQSVFELNPLLEWQSRGYQLPSAPHTLRLRLATGPSERLRARMMWQFEPLSAIQLSLQASVARYASYEIPVHRYRLIEIPQPFSDPNIRFGTTTSLANHVHGQVATAGAGIAARVASTLIARASYRYTYPWSSRGAFREAWAVVPNHRGVADLTILPAPSTSLRARLRYEVGSEWLSFSSVASDSDRTYPSRLAALLLLDFSATKHFWNERVHASLKLSNLLNRHVQLHPAGSVQAFALFARIAFQL